MEVQMTSYRHDQLWVTLNRLRKQSHFCDVNFYTDDSMSLECPVAAHSCVLAACSPILYKKLLSCYSEETVKPMQMEIYVANISVIVWELVLDYIYTKKASISKSLDKNNIIKFVNLLSELRLVSEADFRNICTYCNDELDVSDIMASSPEFELIVNASSKNKTHNLSYRHNKKVINEEDINDISPSDLCVLGVMNTNSTPNELIISTNDVQYDKQIDSTFEDAFNNSYNNDSTSENYEDHCSKNDVSIDSENIQEQVSISDDDNNLSENDDNNVIEHDLYNVSENDDNNVSEDAAYNVSENDDNNVTIVSEDYSYNANNNEDYNYDNEDAEKEVSEEDGVETTKLRRKLNSNLILEQSTTECNSPVLHDGVEEIDKMDSNVTDTEALPESKVKNKSVTLDLTKAKYQQIVYNPVEENTLTLSATEGFGATDCLGTIQNNTPTASVKIKSYTNRSRNKELSFQCETCGKVFLKGQDLSVHIKLGCNPYRQIHTDKMTFKRDSSSLNPVALPLHDPLIKWRNPNHPTLQITPKQEPVDNTESTELTNEGNSSSGATIQPLYTIPNISNINNSIVEMMSHVKQEPLSDIEQEEHSSVYFTNTSSVIEQNRDTDLQNVLNDLCNTSKDDEICGSSDQNIPAVTMVTKKQSTQGSQTSCNTGSNLPPTKTKPVRSYNPKVHKQLPAANKNRIKHFLDKSMRDTNTKTIQSINSRKCLPVINKNKIKQYIGTNVGDTEQGKIQLKLKQDEIVGEEKINEVVNNIFGQVICGEKEPDKDYVPYYRKQTPLVRSTKAEYVLAQLSESTEIQEYVGLDYTRKRKLQEQKMYRKKNNLKGRGRGKKKPDLYILSDSDEDKSNYIKFTSVKQEPANDDYEETPLNTVKTEEPSEYSDTYSSDESNSEISLDDSDYQPDADVVLSSQDEDQISTLSNEDQVGTLSDKEEFLSEDNIPYLALAKKRGRPKGSKNKVKRIKEAKEAKKKHVRKLLKTSINKSTKIVRPVYKALKNHNVCNLCAKTFENGSKEKIRAHQKTECEVALSPDFKNRPKYMCPICSKILSNNYKLTFHIKIAHLGERPYPCIICPATFKDRNTHRDHMMEIHHEGTIKCKFCDLEFYNLEKYKRHKFLAHTNVGDGFGNGVQPRCWICDVCAHRSQSESKHKRHLVFHKNYEEWEFTCDLCDKRFVQPSDLKKHMMIHTGEKPFLCDQCSYSTNRGSNLKLHLRKHVAERSVVFGGDVTEYKCTECSQIFRLRTELKEHLRCHDTKRQIQTLKLQRRSKRQSRHSKPKYDETGKGDIDELMESSGPCTQGDISAAGSATMLEYVQQ